MVRNTLKQLLGLGVILALVAGCASTSDTEEQTTDTSGTTDTSATSRPVPTTPTRPAEVEEEELETVFYFDFDQSIIKPESRAALTAHAARLRNSTDQVRLEGHADERGTREYNMALGERRANAVRDFLVLQGLDRSRIETVSYGEERPARMGSSESAWSANRRVELELQ